MISQALNAPKAFFENLGICYKLIKKTKFDKCFTNFFGIVTIHFQTRLVMDHIEKKQKTIAISLMD